MNRGGFTNLIAAATIGIAIIGLLITVCKVHPFLSLLAGSFTMAVCAGAEYDEAFGSFTSGVGSTIANRNHLRPDLQQTRSQVGTDLRSGKQG